MKIKVGDTEIEGCVNWKIEIKPRLIDHFYHFKNRTVVNVEAVDDNTVKIVFDDGAYLQLQGGVI